MQIEDKYYRITTIICCLILVFSTINPNRSVKSNEDTETEAEYILSSDERIVKSHADLKDALANNNGVTRIYFGADIEIELGGIDIHSSKRDIFISGINPADSAQIIPYTLTEYNSNTLTDAILPTVSGTLNKLVVSDLNIIGKNFYGTFFIPDVISNAALTIIYERVTYTGPQMIYHRYGTSHLIDCEVVIAGTNLTNMNHEFGEVGNLIFEGENTLRVTTTAFRSVFYYVYITDSGVGAFEIKDNSTLNLIADQYAANTGFGTFFTGGSTALYGIDVIIGANAKLYIKTTASLVGFGVTLQSTFKSFTVKQDGKFNLESTSAAATLLHMTGAITVEDGAEFVVKSNGGGSNNGMILNQAAGSITVGQNSVFHLISTGTYSRLLQMSNGGKLECLDPASVLLYNPGGRVMQSATGTCVISATAQQINYWTAAGNGGFDDPPLYHWENPSGNITITAGVGTAGVTSGVNHNYTETEEAPSAANFSMVNARVLSFGRLELVVTEPVAGAASITGVTASGANVRVSFTQNENNYNPSDVTADFEGVFHVNTGISLAAPTVITVKSSHRYLIAESEVAVISKGTIELTVPERLIFLDTRLTLNGTFAKRLDPDWHIIVSDTRGAGREWSVNARLIQALTASDGTKPVLTDALIFVNNSITPLSAQSLLIYHHINAFDDEICKIHWQEDRGILVSPPLNIVYSGLTYTGIIEWTLADVP